MEVSPSRYQKQVEESLQDARVKGYDIPQPAKVVICNIEEGGFVPNLTEFPTIDEETAVSNNEVKDSRLIHEVIHVGQIQASIGRRSREVERRISTLENKAHEISPQYPHVDPDITLGEVNEIMSLKAAAMYSFSPEKFDDVYESVVSTANPFSSSQPLANLEAEFDDFPEAEDYFCPIVERMEEVKDLPVESTGEVFAWLASFEQTGQLADSRPVVKQSVNTNQITSPDFYEGYGVNKEYIADEMRKMVDTYHSVKREGVSDVEFAVEAVNAGMKWFENEPEGQGDTYNILKKYSEDLRPYLVDR